MERLEKWFFREVYQWRLGASILWTMSSIPAICVVFTFLSNFSVFHPFDWIIGSLSSIFSLSFLFEIVIISILTAVLSVFSVPQYKVIPDVSLTRLEALVKLLKPSSIFHAVVYSFGGALVTWVCSTCIREEFHSLWVPSAESSEDFCLNEHHFFLVLYGFFTGVVYHMLFILKQENYLKFQVVQEARFFQVKNHMLLLIFNSAVDTFRKIKYFYLLYYLFGHMPRNWIALNLLLDASCKQPLNTLFGMMDLSLFWQTYLVGVLMHICWCLSSVIFKVFITERYTFQIESSFDEYKNKCLVDAISCNNRNFIQYLGYFDLSELAKHSPSRRKEIFSLSQPGGHPYNWSKLSSVCLSEIKILFEQVQEANWKVFANVPMKNPSGDTVVKSAHNVNETYNVTYRGDNQSTKTDDIPDSKVSQKTKPALSLPQKMTGYLKKKPLFGYLLNELPEARSRKLFSTCQTQIWALDAISNLVTASYTEDQFGVAQRTLPEILTSFLNLQEVVDKHFKVAGSTSRRGQKEICSAKDLPLRFSLQTTLKASIYRIVNTFGKHLVELRLPEDTGNRLRQFIEYKD